MNTICLTGLLGFDWLGGQTPPARARVDHVTQERDRTVPRPMHSPRFSAAVTCFFLVAGCTASPVIEPLATTYPRGRTERVKNIVNLPLPVWLSAAVGLSGGNAAKPVNETIAYSPGTPVLQGNYTETKVGDTAEVEIWIVPRNAGEANEKSLLASLEEGGKRGCEGAYRIKSTKYYFGTEKTLSFRRINSPAVRAKFRCTAEREGVTDSDFRTVAQLASQFRDAAFFDISSFAFMQDQTAVIAGLKAAAMGRNMGMVNEGRRGNGYYLVASRGGNAQSRLLPENLVAFVRAGNGGGNITMLYMTYEQTYHERGVAGAGTEQAGFVRGPQPTSRNLAYDKSRAFVEQVLSSVGK